MNSLERIAHVLACPDCHCALGRESDRLHCTACSRDFLIVGGVPVLFGGNSESTLEEGESAYGNRDQTSLKSSLKRWLPLPNFITARPTLHDRLRDALVFGAQPEALILNLGSGTETPLDRASLINFDIYPHHNADIAGDAHRLPFLDASLDGVWLCAVIEHFRRPFKVAAEVLRVLKPGGFVLVSAPFLYPQHGSPHDYFRYTLDGLRSLFDRFEVITEGVTAHGPFGSWAALTMALAGSMSTRAPISYALRFLVGWMLYPVACLDRIRLCNWEHITIYSATCFLGRKPTTPPQSW